MRVWFILAYLLLGMPYAQASDDDIPAIARPLYTQEEDPEILYRKAVDILTHLNRADDLRSWLYVVNIQASMSTDLNEQKQLFDQALPLALTLNDPTLIVNLQISYAIHLKNAGRMGEAIQTLQDGIKRAEASGQQRLLIDVLFQLAKTSISTGQEIESLKAYRRILAIYHDLPKDSIYYDVTAKAGYLYVQMEIGMEDMGIQLQKEAAAHFAAVPSPFLAFDAFYHLGMTFNKLERFPEAQSAFEQAQRFIDPSVHHFEHAIIEYGRGRAELGLGHLSQAISELEESLQYFVKEGHIRFTSTSAMFLAKAYVAKRDFRAAQALFTEHGNIFEKITDKAQRAELLSIESQIQGGLGKRDEELRLLRLLTAALKEGASEGNRLATHRMASWLELDRKENENRYLQIENEKLQIEARLKDQEIQAARRIRILAFAVSILLLVSLIAGFTALVQKRRVLIAKMKIRRILDNIDEGLLMVSRSLQIEEHYSPYLRTILSTDQDLSGSDVFETLFAKAELSAEERSMLRETMKALLDEDAIAWDLNESHLPRRLMLSSAAEQKVCSLHWCPIVNKDGRIVDILISIRDITDAIAAQEKLQIERARTDSFTQKFGELLHTDQQNLGRLLQSAEDIHADARKPGVDTAALLRRLHTLKGIARTYGIKSLSAAAHELEDVLKNAPQDAWVQSPMLLNFKKNIDDYQELLNRMSSGEIGSPTRTGLLHVVSSLLPALQDHARQYQAALAAVDVNDGILEWPADVLTELELILMHALTNALDHGFIFPQLRGESLLPACLRITAQNKGEGVELSVQDNGAGLNRDKLLQLWRKKGLEPQADQSLAEILFLDGVSTADTLRQTSGRGIGLAAIRESVVRLGGSVELVQAPERGSLLKIQIPRQHGLRVSSEMAS